MRILTTEAMREVDRAAIQEIGIPSLVLMENAAIGVVDAIGERFAHARSVIVLCGPGNNGGDGLAIGRHLVARGYRLRIELLADADSLTGDAKEQLSICRSQGLSIGGLEEDEEIGALIRRCRGYDLIVDALFGTGLSRPLGGRLAELVRGVSELPAPKLAVDLPSGLMGSSPNIPGPCIEADCSVAFAAPKVAHIFPPAAVMAGDIVVADLGIPPDLVRRVEGQLSLAEGAELGLLLAPRSLTSHKGDFGHVLLVAGSEGMSGAAILAAQAAVRGGAGLVTVAVARAILSTVQAGSRESMAIALPQEGGAGLAPAAADLVLDSLEGKAVLAIGPGLGREATTTSVIRRLALESELPLVLDADGLNAFAGELGRLAERSGETLLTPHPGELSRLLGVPTTELLGDRVGSARRAALASGATVLLKGHLTLVAHPDGEVSVNPTGNPGMATGGSGDVLTGLLAALMAQGHSAFDSARIGAFVHGLAGDLAAAVMGEISLSAGDLVGRLGEAFMALSDT